MSAESFWDISEPPRPPKGQHGLDELVSSVATGGRSAHGTPRTRDGSTSVASGGMWPSRRVRARGDGPYGTQLALACVGLEGTLRLACG